MKTKTLDIRAAIVGTLVLAVAFTFVPMTFAATPNWDVSGTWIFDYHYGADVNLHDMTLTQAPDGTLSGSGGAFSGSLPYAYPWTVVSGTVSGDGITFTGDYDNLECTFTATGVISGGTMSGTWTDDCYGARDGTWTTTSGLAAQIAPPASCPVNTTKGALIETVLVNSNSLAGSASVGSLENGQQYLLVSSGTWTNSNNVADTEFASVDGWSTVMDGYDINPYFLGEGEFDLRVDGGFVDWGAYNVSHTYNYLYTGTGSAVSLGVFDGDFDTGIAVAGWYGDNAGNLSVAIYPCMPDIQYVTGGGNYRVGTARTLTESWTFGGNVWQTGAGDPVGQFQLVNHTGKTSYHFDSFSALSLSPDGKTISFDADGVMQGKTKTPVMGVHFSITDKGEPGKEDVITVSGDLPGLSLTANPISGGNFQVFAQ